MNWNRGHSPPWKGGVAVRLQEMATVPRWRSRGGLLSRHTTPAAPAGRGQPSFPRRGMSTIPIHSHLHEATIPIHSHRLRPRFLFCNTPCSEDVKLCQAAGYHQTNAQHEDCRRRNSGHEVGIRQSGYARDETRGDAQHGSDVSQRSNHLDHMFSTNPVTQRGTSKPPAASHGNSYTRATADMGSRP